ncbi:glucan 1,3-alpha-glucosidase [Sulfolobales archaeon HS-7]|nr:glucan 1,3-alpha-glucosidase [Sulfolobales archaeon HS-7]
MTRSIILGNGSLTVLFDSKYRMRELYYPLPTDNHLVKSLIGIFKDGKFAWVHDLQPKVAYQEDTLSSTMEAEFDQVKVKISDAVDIHADAMLRNVSISSPSEVKVFFTMDFNIMGNNIGDTALVDFKTGGMIHYKRDKWFMYKCTRPFSELATGYKEINGLQGTWKDCEDGKLSGNPVAQGSVDSAVGIQVPFSDSFQCLLLAGKNYPELIRLNKYIEDKTISGLIKRTEDYWRAWLVKAKGEEDWIRRSLLIITAHWQNNGAITAALDTDIMRFNRDTYNYVWHRDAAFAGLALTALKYEDHVRNFLLFTKQLLYNGFLFQKYTADGNWGSTWHPWTTKHIPIQEDETAMIVYLAWEHFKTFWDIYFIKPLYSGLIKSAANFMTSFIDEDSLLPLPSYDLWEERKGTHLYTTAAVYAGLSAAANFAQFFGEDAVAERYRQAAEGIRKASSKFYVGDHFARTINEDGSIDKTVDASTLLASILGLYEPKDERVISNRKRIEEALKVNGGIVRYENDMYLRKEDKPNPWIITTLWLAQQYILEDDLNSAQDLVNWVLNKALPTGVLPEQVTPSGEYPSVCPLVWSHAELIRTYTLMRSKGK